MIKFQIHTPEAFHYLATIHSHGWRNLKPFTYDNDTQTLSRIEHLPDNALVKWSVVNHQPQILDVSVEGIPEFNEAQQQALEISIARVLSFHWDLNPFHVYIANYPKYEWIVEQNAGRILVGTSVWEDLAKTLLTTNTTWAQTIAMTERLCSLGDQYAENEYAFPTPQQIAKLDFDDFTAHIRAGYRAAYLHHLAQQIASEELDVERWYGNDFSGAEIYKAIKSLKGFGDYAAGTVLRLLGYFDQVAIDTACRSGYKRVTKSDTHTDKEIKAYYEQFGDWRGLVAWMDVMRRDEGE